MEVEIKILAKDILENGYTSASRCAMTKAFQRAGLDFEEGGGQILSTDRNKLIMNTPEALERKVLAMYAYIDKDGADGYRYQNEETPVTPIKPKNFKYKLSIP